MWLLFQGFNNPHDIAVSNNGEAVYIGEIGPNNLWKFTIDKEQLHST